jgi:hypothetical protein
MACDITSGRLDACKDSVGGLKNAYFIPYFENGWTYTDGVVTAFDVGITEAFKYILVADENTLEETMVSDKNTGTTVNTQVATLSLKRIGAATSNEIKLLAHSRPHIIIEDNMGNYQVVGIEDGCDITSSPKTTGGLKTDFSGYRPVFTSLEKEYAPILDATTITALLAIVSATNIQP